MQASTTQRMITPVALAALLGCAADLTNATAVAPGSPASLGRIETSATCIRLRVEATELTVGDSARYSVIVSNPALRSRYENRHAIESRSPSVVAVLGSQLHAIGRGETYVVARSGTCIDSIHIASADKRSQADSVVLRLITGLGSDTSVHILAVLPLKEGVLFRSTMDSLTVRSGGVEREVSVHALSGTWRDGSLRAVVIRMKRADVIDGRLIAYLKGHPAKSRLSGSGAFEADAGRAVPETATYLLETGVFGKTLPAAESPNASYEQMFRKWSDFQWTTYGSSWNNANYYDRALNHFVYWARTGEAKYFQRAEALALNYRRNYLAAFDYLPAPHNMALEGTALHYWLTGDDSSRFATIRSIDRLIAPYSPENQSKPTYDGRVLHRMITGTILAWELGDQTRDWRALAKRYVDVALAHQLTDGSYSYSGDWNGGQGNFMVGLMNDALIKYYERVESDDRIPKSIQRSAEFLWSTQWKAQAGAFQYASVPLGGNYTITYDTPAYDLNLLIINTIAFAGYTSKDPKWRDAADIVLAGTLPNAWPQGSKQFNQLFYSSHTYFFYRRY